ncbi:hypothetical protein vBPpSSYP_136 [Pseudomonas phage vB_PpS_SYP]|nr:hypothetical protein vBPpSSYP_136 [Pseudomonas phage vB_PpS_SYP]
MPTGFQAFNDGGNLQIDADYRNMLLIKSGQFTASNSQTSADAWYISMMNTWNNTTPFAMIAVKALYPNKLVLTPGSWKGGKKIPNFFFPQNGTSTFQYYIYDLVPPNPAHTYGMQIFKENGELVYSALDYPLKIIDSINTDGGAYTAPIDNTALMCIGGGYFVDDDGVDVESTFTRTWWEGRSVKVEVVHYTNPGGSGGGFWGQSTQWLMVCDVTNVPLNYSRY